MKYLKYIVGLLIILSLAFVFMSTQKKQESPAKSDNSRITEALNNTIGLKPGQKLSNYIEIRHNVLKKYSQLHPDDTLIGIISFTTWMKADVLSDTLKQYNVSPQAIEISFRNEGLNDSEIELAGRSLRSAFQEAMEQRLASKDKNNLPTHGQGTSAELQESIRKKMKQQREQEANAITSGQPIIYGLIVTGRAADFEKISHDSKIRLIDSLLVDENELKHVSLATKIKLKAYKPEFEGLLN